MKSIIKQTGTFIIAMLFSFQSWAEGKGVDVNNIVNKEDSHWYQQLWVWIVGISAFIFFVVIIIRETGKKTQ